MTDPQNTTRPEETPVVAATEVENLLSALSKALRAFNMYQSNNPVFQRFRAALQESFARLWEQASELPMTVTEKGFKYGGRVYGVGEGRDNLAFAFYKDGVRSLTFLPGFEDEVGAFLEAVNRALKDREDADDLITVLWEEDFACLQYGYVDLLMEGLSVPDEPRQEPELLDLDLGSLATEEADEDAETEALEEQASSEAAPKAGLSREDFDETLYFLDQAEMAALQTEVEIEMDRDLRTDVLNALFDRLEEPRPERQAEIMDILDQLLPLFLSRGDMKNAGRVLEELDRLQHSDELVDEDLRERIERLFSRLSDPEVLEQFVQAVEDGAVAPDAEEVNLFFSRLNAQALPILIRFSEMSQSETVRKRLASAIDGLAGRYPKEVNELLVSDEPVVVAGAARVAGRIGLGQAVEGLASALEHPDSDVRMAVVDALVAIRLTPALQALITALDDPDREVRIAAARAIGAIRFASARGALEKIIDGKQVRDADLTEKMAFFEAYGAVGGNGAVERLADVLNSKGFLGRRSPTEMRACAALGLGQAGTPEARQALEKAKSDEDPIVRNAVVRALKEELVTK